MAYAGNCCSEDKLTNGLPKYCLEHHMHHTERNNIIADLSLLYDVTTTSQQVRSSSTENDCKN